MRRGAALVAFLLLVVAVAASQAQAGSGAVAAQETVRNGGFDQGETAWGKVGSLTSSTNEGNPGGGMRIWPSILDQNNLSYVAQQIHLPTTISAASFNYSYHFEAQGSLTNFGGYRVGIYTDLTQAPIITLHEITNGGQIDFTWHIFPKTLSAGEVTTLQNANGAGQPIFLAISLQAANLSVTVDNVSLSVDGAMAYPTVTGEIAFLGQNASNNNTTVNRIKPDGSPPQTLWTHPDTIDPHIYDVAWKPDATETAFSSDHEFGYSAFHADIYGMDPNGGNLRRISNPPQHSSWPNGHATSTDTGKILNRGVSFPAPFLIYFEGAKEPVGVSMPTFDGEVSFTAPDVEDLGVGVLQFVVFHWSGDQCTNGKEYHVAAVDVQGGGTVDVGTLTFDGLCNHYNAGDISWKRDGSQVGFLLGGIPQKVKSSGEAIGSQLFAGTHFSNSDLAWSPVDDRILYSRWRDGTANPTIFLTNAGSDGGSALSIDNQNTHGNPAWLPDGSGFLFTYNDGAAIGKYTFATGQSTMLVQFYGEKADNLSLSPDGQYLVFERQNIDASRRDLWVMNVAQPNEQWALTSDGRSGNPDWSRQNPTSATPTPMATPTQTPAPEVTPTPTPTPGATPPTQSVYLPGVMR